MSNNKSSNQSWKGLLGFFILIVWFMNLVGTTAYIFWASNQMVNAGMIESGFKLFGVLNILASAMAFPAVQKGYRLVTGKSE